MDWEYNLKMYAARPCNNLDYLSHMNDILCHKPTNVTTSYVLTEPHLLVCVKASKCVCCLFVFVLVTDKLANHQRTNMRKCEAYCWDCQGFS